LAASPALLWPRGPGEPWRATDVTLDSAGRAMRRLGPLVADLFLRASSGGRTSGERRVTVALPAFVTELQLTARYPSYLGRADEPLVPGRDTILIPEGTVIVTTGAASVALTAVAWRHGAAVARLSAAGARFGGRLLPGASGDWRLDVTTADGAPLEGEPPELWLRAEAWDNAPTPHVGRSAELALRLPSLGELRAATRAAARDLASAVDSVTGSARELGERTSDLAQERARDAGAARRQPTGAGAGAGAQSSTLPFEASERAEAVAREQQALEQRVQELGKTVEEIARAAKAAGIE